MTKDDILNLLIRKNIISLIDDTYFLTETYKEVLTKENPIQLEAPIVYSKTTNYDALLDPKTNGNDWPSEILDSIGRSRAVAFMDACHIPAVSKKGYRLRGIDKDGINIIGNIVASKDIHPNTFLEAITLYYKHTEMPKSFKNLLAEGDALDIYNEHIEGKLIATLKNAEITNEGTWQ